MEKKRYILVFCLLSFSAAVFSPVAATPPMDDAYYWPEVVGDYVQFPPADSENVQPADTVANNQRPTTNDQLPIIEYTNVQDTTVTVKIKR